jgi:hypothetical protein
MSWQPVAKLIVTPNNEVFELSTTLPGLPLQTLVVTPEHPFWVQHQGWTAAERLREGDYIATSDAGGWATVQQVRGPPRETTTYNFEVANTHTYFVGHQATWVHNQYPVPYLSTDLSRISWEARLRARDFSLRNYGVAELASGEVFIMKSEGPLPFQHSEFLLKQALTQAGIDLSHVVRLYSDRQFCPACQRNVISFLPNAKLEFSWYFNPGNRAVVDATNASMKNLFEVLLW